MNFTNSILIIYILCAFQQRNLSAQEILISKEINLRSELYYDLMGYIEDHFLLYREKPFESLVDIFDRNLNLLRTVNIDFYERKVNVEALCPRDSLFCLYYSTRDKEYIYLKGKKYNKNLRMLDSTTLVSIPNQKITGTFKQSTSEDGKLSLFFNINNDKLTCLVIDNDSFEVLRFSENTIPGINLREEFRSILLSNEGQIFVLFENERKRSNRKSLNFTILESADQYDFVVHRLESKRLYYNNIIFSVDNRNKRILLTGLAGENSENEVEGYFLFNRLISELEEYSEIDFVKFDVKFFQEIYGRRESKSTALRDYSLKDVVWRADGGVILFAEMSRTITRRSAMTGVPIYDVDRFGARGFVDYYNEDLILIALYPDGTPHWRTILYKKQFSQDDEGVFSSFYVFKTPSRLRVIFNDEIKNNNTVGEYILDALGNYERRTVMNTDYLNLKLRFTGAVQASNNELIVPSEKNYRLNLVKIRF